MHFTYIYCCHCPCDLSDILLSLMVVDTKAYPANHKGIWYKWYSTMLTYSIHPDLLICNNKWWFILYFVIILLKLSWTRMVGSTQNNIGHFQTNFSQWPIKLDFDGPHFLYISIGAIKCGTNIYKNWPPILKASIVLSREVRHTLNTSTKNHVNCIFSLLNWCIV